MPPPPSPIAVWSSGHHREPLPFLPYNTINSPPTSAHADPTPSFPFLSFPFTLFLPPLTLTFPLPLTLNHYFKLQLLHLSLLPLLSSNFSLSPLSQIPPEKARRKTGRTGQKRHSREGKKKRKRNL